MATVVEDWHTTAAWARDSPGMAATSIGQYVTMFQAARRARTRYWADVSDPMAAHTRSRSAMRGRTPTKTAATMAGKSRMRTTRSTRLAPLPASPPMAGPA
jgi:hypothetical protein